VKHLILGTAGHIDHGKTSLVKALTGIDTDRLPEEKARGITIELGFAHLDLGEDVRFGIVDVPGHERFVATMVAGVGGMDLVMLTIAADAGVMPQTREHLEICQLLGVKKGLVALTKSDLVDPDWLYLVTEEIREFLLGSFLEGAQIVPVSAKTGAGLQQLKAELARLAEEVRPKVSDGPFRLPVDRVFTMAGFGTIVTGTLLSGRVHVGDEVEILPAGLTGRVRGIQLHGEKSEAGEAGQRLAVNLQGVEHSGLHRGDVAAPRGIYQPTSTLDVRLNYLPSAGRELKHRAMLRLHSGTCEVPAQLILFDRTSLSPGETAYAQLRLSTPSLLLTGDPFILRAYSPRATLGGGTVLDPAPPRRRRRSTEALELLAALESGDDGLKIRHMVANSLYTGLSLSELVSRCGLTGKRLETALGQLLSSGDIIQMLKEPRVFLGRESFTALQEQLLGETEAFLLKNPLKEGISKEELKTRLPKRSDQRFFTTLLASLEKNGRLTLERDLVKIAGSKWGATGQHEGIRTQIRTALQTGGISPPTVNELGKQLAITEKILLEHLHILVREGHVFRVKSDLFYASEQIATIREKLVAFLRENREITPNEFRELTGLSRKFMIPLLEFFDSEKTTIRVGDKRIMRRA
jgi:selenocysteine-specific elongation factor